MPVISIGHGTRPINELLDLLKKYDISWLADVRTMPYSKSNPQCNRESLHRSPEKCHCSKLIGQALQDIHISVQHIDEREN